MCVSASLDSFATTKKKTQNQTPKGREKRLICYLIHWYLNDKFQSKQGEKHESFERMKKEWWNAMMVFI